MKHLIVKSGKDNVGNALDDIQPGDKVTYGIAGKSREIVANEAVPFCFKMSLMPIPKGQQIICYGEMIGVASMDIPEGSCVHVHNVVGKRGNQ